MADEKKQEIVQIVQHQHQHAPTAEMIKLYDEMRVKAFDSVLAMYKTTDTTVDSVITVLSPIGCGAGGGTGQDLHIVFKLNGEEVKMTVTLTGREMMLCERDGKRLGQIVFEKIAQRLAEKIVEMALKEDATNEINRAGAFAMPGLKLLLSQPRWG